MDAPLVMVPPSVVLRKRLASIFNACILSRPCSSDCSHQHKKVSPHHFDSAHTMKDVDPLLFTPFSISICRRSG